LGLKKNDLDLHIIPIGGLYVTDQPKMLQTVLGSCVSITLFDRSRKIGGMNHIVLPGAINRQNQQEMFEKRDTRYGIFSIEQMIHQMRTLGGVQLD